MKKDAISTGLFIAIGFLCVAIVIAVLIPVVREVIDATDDNKPDIPGVTLVQPMGSGSSQTATVRVFTHTSV